MTTLPQFPDAPPLRTEADVLERVTTIVGHAVAARTLWLLLIDGHDRQAPVVVPMEDVPVWPDDVPETLSTVLAGIAPQLATGCAPGSVVFVLERRGRSRPTDPDRAWATALHEAGARAEVAVRGIYLSTSRGVRRLDTAPDARDDLR